MGCVAMLSVVIECSVKGWVVIGKDWMGLDGLNRMH